MQESDTRCIWHTTRPSVWQDYSDREGDTMSTSWVQEDTIHRRRACLVGHDEAPGFYSEWDRRQVVGQEATVRTRHETDWFKIGKGVCQGCILPSYLFNLCAEYIMPNARLDESQAGINIAGENINNLRHVDDTILMAESEEELNRLLMKVKEEWKSWL